MSKPIPQMEPVFDPSVHRSVSDYALSGGWFTEFKQTQKAEQIIADFIGVKHCVMMPNATLALYAILKCLDVGLGDEVIVPAFTMIATANAVRMTGAKVVFCDISPHNLCLAPNWWLASSSATAVIAVSLNGRDHRMEFESTVRSGTIHETLMIEDAAQAFGSMNGGNKHIGTIGTAGCFSFGPLKIISSGQGGCVVTNQDGLAAKIRSFKTFGRSQEGADDYQSFGINLRYTDLQASVLIEQLKEMPVRIKRKREMFALYQDLLSGVEEVGFVTTRLAHTVPWFIDILCNNGETRDGLKAYLEKKGIATRSFYPPLHRTPVYAEYNDLSFPYAESASSRGLWLPSSTKLTNQEIRRVCDEIKRYCRQAA